MTMTKIEWTEETWNPSKGCSKISLGCQNCYAEVMAHRLKAMGVYGYENGFQFSIVPERLNDPLKKKKPTKFFVNSMSDLFHEKMPINYLDQIFNVIRQTPHHIYQILTKRASNMVDYFDGKDIPQNVWVGVTVEDRINGFPRLDLLRNLNASIKFLSVEPLLEDLGGIDLHGIDWVIVGGESGPRARKMKEEWALNIKTQCDIQNVAFFFKQWGTWGVDGVKRSKKQNGRQLRGEIYDEFPSKLSEMSRF